MNKFKNLTTKIKTFYSTNRTQKLAISAVGTTVVAGAVAFALLSTPVISPLMSNISDGAIFTKDAEKDKISKDDTKKDEAKDESKKDESKDEAKKDDDKKDESKDEAKNDTGTAVSEDNTTPESTPNTKPSNNKPSSNQTAHTHDWQPNMITIPEVPERWNDRIIPGRTYEQGYYTWPDGCKVKATDYGAGGSTAAEAEHTAKHGQQEIGYTTETVTIEPETIRTIVQERVPEHQEQRGWKCSCGATKE